MESSEQRTDKTIIERRKRIGKDKREEETKGENVRGKNREE